MKKMLAIIFLILLIAYAMWQAVEKRTEVVGVEIGNKAPDFNLQALDGTSLQLSSLNGKKVLVNFWASWCGPCKEEMPEMQKFYEEHMDDIEVVAINMTATEVDLKNAEAFIKESSYTFPVLFDVSNKTSSTYEVLTLPTSYFINSKGIIKEKVLGQMTVEVMEEKMEKMK